MTAFFRSAVWVTAAASFIVARRVCAWLLRTLPADHPFRVAQESVYAHISDDLIRRSWRTGNTKGGGKVLRKPARCFRLAAVTAVTSLPLALLIPGSLFA